VEYNSQILVVVVCHYYGDTIGAFLIGGVVLPTKTLAACDLRQCNQLA